VYSFSSVYVFTLVYSCIEKGFEAMTKIVTTIALVATLACATAANAATLWNYSSDFSLTTNPHSDWTYGCEMSEVGFESYSVPNAMAYDNGLTVTRWSRPGNIDGTGSADKTTTTEAKDVYGVYWEPNATYVMPGLTGDLSPVVIRWTAPTTGTYDLSATWGSADIGGITNQAVAVKIGGLGQANTFSDTLNGFIGRAANGYADATGTHPSSTYTGTNVALTAGQTVDFITYTASGPAGFPYTKFDANVTLVSTPEPASMVILATGLIGLLAYAWRKRK
jgi:hypothetical protein